MLCYVSLSDNHSGKFLGGVHLEAADVDAACAQAAALLPDVCGEAVGCEIPPHVVDRVPRDVLGKLLTRRELEALSRQVNGEGLVEMISDGETLRRAPPDERVN